MVHCFDKFCEGPARVAVHLEVESHLIRRQIGQVHGIQLLLEGSRRDLRHDQGRRLVVELVQALHDVSQRRLVGHSRAAILAVRGIARRQSVVSHSVDHFAHARVLAAMLPAFERVEHLLHQVIDEEHLEHHARIVHRDRQVVRDVVAEGAHRRIVVGAHPLADQIWEPVHQYFGPGLRRIVKKQLLPGFLGQPVLRFPKAPSQRRLDRTGQHDRRLVPVLLQSLQQRGRKAKIPLPELLRILGAVHASQGSILIALNPEFYLLLTLLLLLL